MFDRDDGLALCRRLFVMRLDDLETSSNVEDRRGKGGGKLAVGGGLGGVILMVLYVVMGGNPEDAGKMLGGSSGSPATYDAKDIEPVSKVLRQTEIVWKDLFKQNGLTYKEAPLVVFTEGTESGCGFAESAIGPFYCPADSKVYIDLGFYNVMEKDLGAGGDFAQAYVIAHEVGHHIQNLLGTSDQVHQEQERSGKTQANALSVRLELQADFYAGVWAHHAKDLQIDQQDIKEAMNAAHQIGDDALQKRAQGRVVPDSFTHGTSEQRMRWFMKGYQTGDMKQGDTFNTRNL